VKEVATRVLVSQLHTGIFFLLRHSQKCQYPGESEEHQADGENLRDVGVGSFEIITDNSKEEQDNTRRRQQEEQHHGRNGRHVSLTLSSRRLLLQYSASLLVSDLYTQAVDIGDEYGVFLFLLWFTLLLTLAAYNSTKLEHENHRSLFKAELWQISTPHV